MKRLWVLVVSAGWMTVLSGCGGGGGSTSVSPSSAVQSRLRALDSAMTGENVTSLMTFYSDNYLGEDGETKADVQAEAEEQFATTDVLSITVTAEQFTITPSGGEVVVDTDYRIVIQNETDGEQGTFTTSTTTVWRKEGEAWRIVSVSGDEPVQVAAAALRK